ncbi:unnamed protein product [Echinostoma caproni]|uniref:SNF2_N domain-containing protein n=1 Tax=Echinostoma caproni TaxID=27848 RepID=A0A183AV53_9TREM|nr:unnamed protein product [Echinostoma caproni]
MLVVDPPTSSESTASVVQPERVLPAPNEEEAGDSSDSEDLGDFFEHYFAGDDDPGSSDSDNGAGTGTESVVMINQVGALVRGKERLMELSDCYVMHLDTTLYDLCLRRLRVMGPSRTVLLTLPTKILHDLKRLYYSPYGVDTSGRKSTSG